MWVRTRRIGAVTVGAVGFGAMQLDDPAASAERAEATLRAALMTLKEMHDSGQVRMVGIANTNPAQIRQARDILGSALVSVQNKYSPLEPVARHLITQSRAA